MGRRTARVEAFSDGVLAIVITLLVLEIRVPHLHDVTSAREAWIALQSLGPKFGAFALSFAYVAVFWVNHHHFFDLVDDATPGLIWMNNLLLLFLCFVPFPTAFIGEYPANPMALAFFALVLMCAGLAFTLMFGYAFRRGLLIDAVRPHVAQGALRRGLLGPPLYAAAAAGGFWSPGIAWAIFGAVPVFFFLHSMQTPWRK
jgi:uncharacterized membrane protein